MELRDYLKVYWSQRWMIIMITAVAAIAAAVATGVQPTKYGVTESFAINRINKEPTPDYQYDGYYALQAADLFAQTVVSWFSTPSVLRDVYQQANLDPEISSLNRLPGRFKVKKYSAQNIVVRFSESTSERADKVATAIRSVMETKSESLNQSENGKSIFSIVGQSPVIAAVPPSIALYTIVAAVFGCMLGLFAAVTRHYLRS